MFLRPERVSQWGRQGLTSTFYSHWSRDSFQKYFNAAPKIVRMLFSEAFSWVTHLCHNAQTQCFWNYKPWILHFHKKNSIIIRSFVTQKMLDFSQNCIFMYFNVTYVVKTQEQFYNFPINYIFWHNKYHLECSDDIMIKEWFEINCD